MFDYQRHFDACCRNHRLPLRLSFAMPPGYESANGMYDDAKKTVFVNAERLKSRPDAEQAFYLFHELRHALQYCRPEDFGALISRSLQYVIRYDGVCYKQADGQYLQCRLSGSSEYLMDLYLGQPHEADANDFAYAQVKRLYGDSPELRRLRSFWPPRHPLSNSAYEAVYAEIDSKIKQ